MALGLALLFLTVAEVGATSSTALLIPALLLDGAGMGMVLAPLSSLVLAGLPVTHAGGGAGGVAAMQPEADGLGGGVVGGIFYTTLSRGGADTRPRAFCSRLRYSG